MNEHYVHATAVIDDGATIGAGTRIWHFCHVMSDAIVGEQCVLGQGVFVGRGARIGNRVKIQNHVSVYDGVVIEDNVFCGPSCTFTNVLRPRAAFPTDPERYAPTHVCRGATLGAHATIVCGHTLGAYCFVGAGAVVTADVPAHALVHGNPARIHGYVCACGASLEFEEGRSTCPRCGSRYTKDGTVVAPADGRSSGGVR